MRAQTEGSQAPLTDTYDEGAGRADNDSVHATLSQNQLYTPELNWLRTFP
jgi:hypothetical protein